jgi:hypothetical protein
MLLLTVSSGTGRPYTLNHLGHHVIVSERISIGKILARALLCLLLCGMFAGQLPELLSLTDNAKNDFSVTDARPVVPPVRLNARKPFESLIKILLLRLTCCFRGRAHSKKQSWFPLTFHSLLHSPYVAPKLWSSTNITS